MILCTNMDLDHEWTIHVSESDLQGKLYICQLLLPTVDCLGQADHKYQVFSVVYQINCEFINGILLLLTEAERVSFQLLTLLMSKTSSSLNYLFPGVQDGCKVVWLRFDLFGDNVPFTCDLQSV